DEVAGILRPTLRQLADPANHDLVPLTRLLPAGPPRPPPGPGRRAQPGLPRRGGRGLGLHGRAALRVSPPARPGGPATAERLGKQSVIRGPRPTILPDAGPPPRPAGRVAGVCDERGRGRVDDRAGAAWRGPPDLPVRG